ncbi:MAG: hypothetical protein JWP76_3084 [Dactylosporangium sp.]|jgi:hypothetical protein|nr:hypothetical protein [Dactylosporangium sp.]
MVRFVPSMPVLAVAGLATVAVLPVAIGAATGTKSQGHAAVRPPATAGPTPPAEGSRPMTFTTRSAAVRIRAQPNTGTTSRIVGTIDKAGTGIAVACYVTGQAIAGNNIWYRTVNPAGHYIAGRYLTTGHDPAAGVVRC